LQKPERPRRLWRLELNLGASCLVDV
jgi:hypothetical protein